MTISGVDVGRVLRRFCHQNRVFNFDVCLQDDGNGDSFQFISTTGEYKFTQAGVGGVTLVNAEPVEV